MLGAQLEIERLNKKPVSELATVGPKFYSTYFNISCTMLSCPDFDAVSIGVILNMFRVSATFKEGARDLEAFSVAARCIV